MPAISSPTATGSSWSTTSAEPAPSISSPVSSIVSGRSISDGPAVRLLRPVDEEAGAGELDGDRPSGATGRARD
jgi:hypothetical protein